MIASKGTTRLHLRAQTAGHTSIAPLSALHATRTGQIEIEDVFVCWHAFLRDLAFQWSDYEEIGEHKRWTRVVTTLDAENPHRACSLRDGGGKYVVATPC